MRSRNDAIYFRLLAMLQWRSVNQNVRDVIDALNQ